MSNDNEPNAKRQRRQLHQPLIIPSINTGSILSDPTLDDNLIGTPPSDRASNPDLYDGLTVISSFLRQHQFLSSNNEGGGSAGANSNNAGLSRIYKPTIEEFTRAQIERQAAGLRTNTNGASSSDMKNVVDCHATALQYGLDTIATQERWVDKIEDNLTEVHKRLCPTIPQSGRYRTSNVKTANIRYPKHEDVRGEADKFALAVTRYQQKWTSSSTAIMNEQQWREQVYQGIALTTIVMFGLSNIHPFQDGNGRTGRIFLNVALKKFLGLPFSVIITATFQQRREYVDALNDCRTHLLKISSRQEQAQQDRNNISTFIFEKLIHVVFDRVLQAVKQANSLIEAKTHAASVEEEAKITREIRERSAEGQCVICLDDNPNISTLCCGQVVHMACLAQWLGNQGSCIGCRKPMPRLIQRTQHQAESQARNDFAEAVAAAVAAANVPDNGNDDSIEETTDDTTSDLDNNNTTEEPTTEDTTTVDDAGQNVEEETTEIEDTTTAHENENQEVQADETTEDTVEDDNENNNNQVQVDETTEDTIDDVTEETTAMDDNALQQVPDTTEDTTEDSTADSNGSSQQQQSRNRSMFCGQCQRNRFAIDCSNELCGSCCQLYGSMGCARHNC